MTEDLIQKLDDVIEESKKIREIAGTVEEAQKNARRRVLITTVVIGVVVALLLAGMLWVALENRHISNTIACYTMEGEPCFERQQDQAGQVIQRIIDAQIAAVECRDETDIRACVEQKLSP